jgi:hypothetical protein
MDEIERTAYISQQDLKDLQLDLDIEAAGLGTRRERGDAGIPQNSKVQEIKSEILDNYRNGVKVKIHPHAESLPLIPLYKAAKEHLPPELKVDHDVMGYDYYLVSVTFGIMLPSDQFPLYGEFKILEINDDIKDKMYQARPVQLFPGRKDITLFTVELEAGVTIDTSMNFSVSMSGSTILPFMQAQAQMKAQASGEAHAKAKIIAGPYSFNFCKAAVEVSGESDKAVWWKYNLKSELRGKNDFKSYLIMKVFKKATSLNMIGSLSVTPYKQRWGGLFKEKLKPLSDPSVPLPVQLVQKLS